jgi:putative transposase
MVASASGKGNCYDNAVMESFYHTLKVEMIYGRRYRTRSEAQTAVFDYIEIFYNRQRLHSSLDYQTPEAFERAA